MKPLIGSLALGPGAPLDGVPRPPATPAREGRATAPSLQPAPEGSGRIFALQTITRIDQLPPYKAVLTAVGGLLTVSQDVRERMVALQAESGGPIVVMTNLSDDRKAFATISALMRHAKLPLSPDRLFEATEEIVGLFYGSGAEVASGLKEFRGQMDQLFDEIVGQGIELNASDIHLQMHRNEARILMRVNGDLMQTRMLRRDVADKLSEAIFNFADSDSKQTAFDRKSYQDASITRTVYVRGQLQHVELKLRFASMVVYPDAWDIVLRLLPMGQGGTVRSLAKLGYDNDQHKAIDRMLSRPSGMICLVGTTGSGKSTTIQTLCGMLAERYQGRKLIRTIEDPCEYIIPGARQTPVIRKASESEGSHGGFAAALKAAMRGDPDVIMVGEVRDAVTASLLQQAVQTGHKVLTTVHAGNPFDAIDRLIDLGCKRSVIAGDDFISGIIYQRLLPLVCPHCALPIDQLTTRMDEDVLRRINTQIRDLSVLRFRNPTGCEQCHGQGVLGRTVVGEMLVPNRHVLRYVLKEDKSAMQAYWRGGFLVDAAKVNGRTALDQAIEKMRTGLVSPIDVEHELGYMDDQERPDEAKAWFNREFGEHRARNP